MLLYLQTGREVFPVLEDGFCTCLRIAIGIIDPVRHRLHKVLNVSKSYGSAPVWTCAYLFDVGWELSGLL